MRFIEHIFLVTVFIFPINYYYAITFIVAKDASSSPPDNERSYTLRSSVDMSYKVNSASDKRSTTDLNYRDRQANHTKTVSVMSLSHTNSKEMHRSMEQTTDIKEAEEHVHSHSEITQSLPGKDTLLLNKFANPISVNYATRNLFKNRILRGNENLRNTLAHPVIKSFKLTDGKDMIMIDKQVRKNLLPIRKLAALRRALLIHPFETVIKNGRNVRLKQKLLKVLQGVDVYLDVIGGSHTAGSGIEKEEGGIQGVFHRVITDWWGKAITPVTGSELKTRGIGISGTPSDFFQYCFRSYVHKQLDLVFLESAVNDMRKPVFEGYRIIPLEQLTRQLLVYPTEPALVYINFFSGESCNKSCSNLELCGQNNLTDIYNITTLSLREAVCLRKTGSDLKACDLVCKDRFHNNQLAHAHISLMVINLFRRILLDSLSSMLKNKSVPVSRETNSTRDLVTHAIVRGISRQNSQLPQPVFIRPGHLNTHPLCWTSLTPNYKRNVINNSLDMIVTKTMTAVLTVIAAGLEKPWAHIQKFRSKCPHFFLRRVLTTGR